MAHLEEGQQSGYLRADLVGIRDAQVVEFGQSSDPLVGLEQTLRRLVELGGRLPSEDLSERAEPGADFELDHIDSGLVVDDPIDVQSLAELIGVEIFDVFPGQPELRGVLGERSLVDGEEGGLVGLAEECRAEAALKPVDPLFERADQLLGQFLAARSRRHGPLLDGLLAETLELPAARAFVLDRICTPELVGPTLAGPLRRLADAPMLAELGGDIHVLGRGVVLIGMGERTTRMGAEILARRLLRSAQAQATTVIAVRQPKSHAYMHLDTGLTMIDVDTFVRYPNLDPAGHAIVGDHAADPEEIAEHDTGGLHVEHREDLFAAIADAPGLGKLLVLSADEAARAAERRAMGRREQLPHRRPLRRHGLQAEHCDQWHDARAPHRGHQHPRQRARPRARRDPLHDLPHSA